MDLQALVDEITELVIAQLGRVSHSAGPGSSGLPQTLIVMGDGERGAELLSTHIRASIASGGRVAIVPSASWPRARIAHVATPDGRVRVVDAPPAWGALVTESRVVLVPNLAMSELSAVTRLLHLTPASGALLAALVEGRAALAGGDDIHLYAAHAARLPKALVEAARACAARAAAMGVKVMEAKRLADEILVAASPPSPANGTLSGARDVLTRDDVEAMLRSGVATIEVAAGTIVTPLALEVARAAGADIVVR